MADRGLFSFDIDSYLKPDLCYFRVAIPKSPLRFPDLPDKVREILGRTVLRDRYLAVSPAIQYSVTLSM